MNLEALRAQFPVTRQWAFLDHAAVAPLPEPAVAALRAYADDLATSGVTAVGRCVARVGEVRALAARLINAPAVEDVYFVPNTTHGIGAIAEGFPWEPGDNVVLAAEEYPANQFPWMNLARKGVSVRKVPSRGNRVPLDDLAAAMDARTRVLTVSFVEFASGFRHDLCALGDLCKARGAFFFVDAIQGLGAFPLDVQAAHIDALSADSHKWLLGPEGAGFGYIRREWVERLHPVGVGAFSVNNPLAFTADTFDMKPHAGRWEGGALNVGGIGAMGASLQLLLDFGIENARARVLELTGYLCDNALSRGWSVFSSRAGGEASGIVSLVHPARAPDDVVKRCRAAGVAVNARGGRVRVSPHCYNTTAEIDRFLEAAGG